MKHPVYNDKSSAVCLETFSQGVMTADKLEASTSKLFYEPKQDKLQGKNKLYITVGYKAS
jgi:hypothetical protein